MWMIPLKWENGFVPKLEDLTLLEITVKTDWTDWCLQKFDMKSNSLVVRRKGLIILEWKENV